jgi:DNA-directed RNA polymerase specialized sigma24 family protein
MSESLQSTKSDISFVGACCDPEMHALLPEQLYQGSLEAFAHLVKDYKTPLFQFFQRLLADNAVAEDSSEEVFLRAYRMRNLLKARTDLTAWIFRIACDLLRHRELLAILKQASSAGPIQQALRTLPVQQQIAILLHRFGGLRAGQIGAALRVRESAAWQLIVESYRALQQQITRYSPNPLQGAAQ